MNRTTIQEAIRLSLDGTPFPRIVQMLAADGVESYHVDLMRGENRYYDANGESLVEPVPLNHSRPAATFSAEAVKQAIKEVQTGTILYPEFLERIIKAGTSSYVAYLSGKRVIYSGRQGDFHVEHFPR